jgi:cytochrome c2
LTDGLRWSGHGIIEIPAEAETASITVFLKPTDMNFVRPVEKLTGTEIFRNFCSACHSTDGTKLIGPTFQGLSGREQTVTRDGKEIAITTDADYLRESILKPQAAIVKGYEAVPMADFSAVLTKDQVDLLVNYLTEH